MIHDAFMQCWSASLCLLLLLRSSSAVAACAERENLTALPEYREAALVISRKHLLKALKVLCLSFCLDFTAH